jgi:hypothetical protein
VKATISWPEHLKGQQVEIVNSPAENVCNTIMADGEPHVFHGDNLEFEPPIGLTGLDPMPYGYKRWNGSVWPNIQVDRYNAELARIASRHNAGYDVQNLIDGLYNLAHGFDYAGKD